MSAATEIVIRSRRALFNRAIADGDTGTIATLLARNAVLVTGTDSAVITGRKEQVAVWRREFAALSRMTYVRTPETIVASPIEPIAFEHGCWQGTTAAALSASGAYTAKWRQMAGQWVIEAELYLTLA